MNAIRRAPSAVNMQPWRFYKEDNFIHAFTVKRILVKHLESMNRIDVGIALCHLRIALENSKKNFQFEYVDNVSRKGLNYITSVFLS